ncbi:MAG: hypothetical protein GX868_00025 [Actinobacteria bacterium]|nr:hypothetical protein [Actinomycetota bacterium]
MSNEKISPEDIKAKLSAIQDDAASGVEGAKSQLVTAAAVLALVVVLLAFLMGRRAGTHKNTIIEVKRG